ncbi:MAG: hypothetical protein K8S14_07550 [Actinomycetia bacterium]|nr:hypothetical protein [Actinomycetes bacterium]
MINRIVKIASITLVLVMVLTIVIGCETAEPEKSSSSVPFFPTQKEPATSYMEALLSDKPEELIIRDGCLRAGGYLLVWPYGFSLSTDKDGIFQVIDSTGQPVARVGDKVRISGGGGEMSGGDHGDITAYSTQLPCDHCPGPYWIVGETIEVTR